MTIDARSLELFVDFVRKNSWLPGNDPAMMRAFNAYTKVEGYDVDLTGMKEIIEDVPEVEVTSRGSSELVAVPQTPLEGRRSGAKNVSDSRYQTAFISEARSAMGQPGLQEAESFLGEIVVLTFNQGMAPRQGVLSDIIEHPANPNGPSYLILNDDTDTPYPLNSIQSIKLAET